MEDVAAVGVEPGVGLVEQQELRVPDQRGGEREPPPLSGGELAVGQVGDRARARAARWSARRPRPVAAPGLGEEPEVLAHGQVVVAEGLVADEGEIAPGAAPVLGQIEPVDLGLARVERRQTRDQAEQRGLAGAVRPGQQEDLAGVDVKVDPGQSGEASEKAHGGAESDDERHASLRGPGWGATSADECTDRLRRRSNRHSTRHEPSASR